MLLRLHGPTTECRIVGTDKGTQVIEFPIQFSKIDIEIIEAVLDMLAFQKNGKGRDWYDVKYGFKAAVFENLETHQILRYEKRQLSLKQGA